MNYLYETVSYLINTSVKTNDNINKNKNEDFK